ncbi:MAG: NAD(P)H-hydrate epimerase [Planctomycetes bacterium]|nr:NAD(P)H-hydrate epimerase [Planctomycetota bacterium]
MPTRDAIRTTELFILSPDASREIDRRCATKYGLSTLVLMENASVCVAEAAMELANGHENARVLIVAGSGNNGGDALGAARHLSNFGAAVSILMVGSASKRTPDTTAQLKTCRRMKLPVVSAGTPLARSLERALRQLPLPAKGRRRGPLIVVDGLFGTGLSRTVEGVAADAVRAMNALRESGARIVSIDLPSGMNGESGEAMGVAVRADVTVTFVGLKTGMLAPGAIDGLGRVVVADIGVPRQLVESLAASAHRATTGRRRGI